MTLFMPQYLQFRHMTRRAGGFIENVIIHCEPVLRLLLFEHDRKL